MDDDEDIRKILAVYALKAGLRPVLAKDGQEALELFLSRKYRFEIVLTDLQMPRMDGLALLAEIGRLAPTIIRVLSTSTDTRTDIAINVPKPVPLKFFQQLQQELM